MNYCLSRQLFRFCALFPVYYHFWVLKLVSLLLVKTAILIHPINGSFYIVTSSFVYIMGFTAPLFCPLDKEHILGSSFHNMNTSSFVLDQRTILAFSMCA